MNPIILKTILDKYEYPEAGTYVFGFISAAIELKQKIALDMAGVISVPTVFLNAAFGETIDTYGTDVLKQTIGFKNVSKSQAERIQKYILEYENIIEEK